MSKCPVRVAAVALATTLTGCAQPPARPPQPQWFVSTSMMVDATALGARRPGTIAWVRPAVRYVFRKTSRCRVEPKALNALAHLTLGQWILRKTSDCYVTHPGQLIEIDLDSGKVIRVEQFDRPSVFTGDRVWVGGVDGAVWRITDASASAARTRVCAPTRPAEGGSQAPNAVLLTHSPFALPQASHVRVR